MFVSHLNGDQISADINATICKMYSARKGIIIAELLLACKLKLVERLKRGNYQSKIWKSVLIAISDAPSPEGGQGWEYIDNKFQMK